MNIKDRTSYATYLLADEIDDMTHKARIAKKMIDVIFNGMIDEESLLRTDRFIVAESYKDLFWKLDVLNDYLHAVLISLQKLDEYSEAFYKEDNAFLLEVASLLNDVAAAGKVDNKKLSSVFGFSTPLAQGITEAI